METEVETLCTTWKALSQGAQSTPEKIAWSARVSSRDAWLSQTRTPWTHGLRFVVLVVDWVVQTVCNSITMVLNQCAIFPIITLLS